MQFNDAVYEQIRSHFTEDNGVIYCRWTRDGVNEYICGIRSDLIRLIEVEPYTKMVGENSKIGISIIIKQIGMKSADYINYSCDDLDIDQRTLANVCSRVVIDIWQMTDTERKGRDSMRILKGIFVRD